MNITTSFFKSTLGLVSTLFVASIPLAGCNAEEADGAEAEAEVGDVQEVISAPTKPKGKVLIVLSTADRIKLADGSDYITGVFMRELSEPLKKLWKAGYQTDFASIGGKAPTWDLNGLELFWFFWGDSFNPLMVPFEKIESYATREEAIEISHNVFGKLIYSPKKTISGPFELDNALARWKAQEKNLTTKPLLDLATMTSDAKLKEYVGLFVPGGHAPMTDLSVSKDMGTILKHFHDNKKPTSLICHAPIALMATKSEGWSVKLTEEQKKQWPYYGYTVTVASTTEEHALEKFFTGGKKVAYYVDQELEKAGARLRQTPIIGGPMVSADRELVTGQSPSSAAGLGDKFVESIELYKKNPTKDWWTSRK